MKQLLFLLAIALISCTATSQDKSNTKKNNVFHTINATVNPESSFISVIDTLDLSNSTSQEFVLNAALTPKSLTKGITLFKIEENTNSPDVGMDRDAENKDQKIKLTRWRIKGLKENVIISYSGIINIGLENGEEDYQRGFSQTSGIINKQGTYLAGATYWTPTFDEHLMTYKLTTVLPVDWKNVSQGQRIYNEVISNQHIDIWFCDKPQEEIFLIAAKFSEYSYKMNNGVDAMAFLRTPDEGLANKYLEVTEQYMTMYEEMLGNYPYSKFALVENFWETGYGMPSFTLLGEKIIRFPFILHSSYPHELLHNWWGNSVYVDFESGNWCEGLTAFMADHLIKEQRGIAEEYRRSTLQKFSNLVDESSDFPLTEFLSRHDGPTEAIGYGKALMMWQMLRRKLGDDLFVKGVRLFNENNIYKTASYTDIRLAMEEVSGIDLSSFFTQWTTRKGAPELAIKNIETTLFGGKHSVVISISQVQNSEAYRIDLPINILTAEGLETFVFDMTKKEQEFQINLKSKPLKLVVDAQYDVFRILNPSEVPPTLSKIWGNKENVFILPSKASKEQKAIYEQFANDWISSDNDNFEIKYDNEFKTLPEGKASWIIGFENKFANDVENQIKSYNSSILGNSIVIDSQENSKKGNSLILTLFDAEDHNSQNIFIAFDNKQSIAGLIRKLPHYGKYSYLGFEGDEPTNILKGQWPVLNSPMIKVFDEKSQKSNVNEERPALAELKPIFSETKMLESIKYLASEEMKGRGIGTPEIDVAAAYIARKFEEAGLQPIGDDYYQKFSHTFDEKGEINLTNVIGIIPGVDEKLKNEPIVISAHYDHLGMGWPDVHQGDEGKIHYGADDNASGTATIIELARIMAKTAKPKRTIVFLACTAEEAGLIGSRYFVEHGKEYFKGDFFANVNIDTDGSLFDKQILVLNGNSATEWVHIFNGFGYTTGIKAKVVNQHLDASDQVAFIEKGIPAIQLFTGATEHYHRPSDTYETIDGKGMVTVATLTKGVLEYLAEREDPMHFVSANIEATNNTHNHDEPKTDRKASTGSVPDFAYEGTGVRVGSIVSGSAGEKAGLLEGDIIIALDKTEVADLRQYSNLLKEYQPGDKITLKITRGDQVLDLDLTLGAR